MVAPRIAPNGSKPGSISASELIGLLERFVFRDLRPPCCSQLLTALFRILLAQTWDDRLHGRALFAMKKITLTCFSLALFALPVSALPVGTNIDIELLAAGTAPHPLGLGFIDTLYDGTPATGVTIVDPGMELQIDAISGFNPFGGPFIPDFPDPSTSGFLAFDIHEDHGPGHTHGTPSVAGSTWIWLKWMPAFANEDVIGTFTLSNLPAAQYDLLYDGNGIVLGPPSSGGNEFELTFQFIDDGTMTPQALGLQINPVSTPDGGTTGALLGVAVGAMAFARRATRKQH